MPKLKSTICSSIYPYLRENRWIHAFPKVIRPTSNTNQPYPGFEIGPQNLFSTITTVKPPQIQVDDKAFIFFLLITLKFKQ